MNFSGRDRNVKVKMLVVCEAIVLLGDRFLSVLSFCNAGVLWPNGWMDPDETWHAGMPWPRPHCVRWGPSSSSPNRGRGQSPQFSAHVCCGQVAAWIKMPFGKRGRPRPKLHVRWGPSSPSPKGGRAPNFRPMSIVAKRLDGSRWHLA